ncbi:methyltransferase domain-containing protein [Dissulfurirhabdus thermomarina]|uniref:Malonyl-[acyl-carrier protein] O-methyltransferase n=1 Tax=Dissulfurirhabdus thermomarina TaxID=1765737 RepID=A0A6N9TX81_DISTH|nr:methyltransferase domain-containing protein [Dissulfurirhabdus thermomarina]NDY43086.1 methyltransferase domain-containing protein [Dissulfurirhabdus thermomarina]NMX22697.1 methyltransferase domain-containing protein [Dissulfurirhabdus thermomarina]
MERNGLERRFARAAATYDRAADVQAEVARALAARLGPGPYPRILEIGCGTGLYTQLLHDAFPDARIEAVDLADEMIRAARARLPAGGRVRFHRCDAEAAPPACGDGYDLVTSSGAFQWFRDPAAALRRYARLLRPGGRLAFATFGPGTLSELAEALQAVFGREVPIPARGFPGRPALHGMLEEAFARARVDRRRVTRRYPDVRTLLRRLKETGVTGPGGARVFLTRGRLECLEAAFRRRHGGVVAGYEVFYCDGWTR